MADTVIRKDSKDIWDCEGGYSFVKAKTSMFQTSEDHGSKLILDFVEHEGKKNGCKLKNNISIFLSVVGAGNDIGENYGGTGLTGVNALSLAKQVRSCQFARTAVAAREEAKKSGSKYAKDIWGVRGGGNKNGKVVYRRFSISPADKDPRGYVFKAEECDGYRDNDGKINPTSGSTKTVIRVPVSAEMMDTLAEYIISEWTAFRTAELIRESGISAQPAPAAAPAPTAAPAEVQVQVAEPKYVYFFYDKKFFGPMTSALSPEEAVEKCRECFRRLKAEKNLVFADQNQADKLKGEILSPQKTGWLTPVSLVTKGGAGDADELFVMVDVRS